MSSLNIPALVIACISAGIAFYAATLSRRALKWQQQRDAERIATRARVEFAHAARSDSFGVWFADDPDPRPDPQFYELTLVVVNDGESIEYVASVDVHDAVGEHGHSVMDPWEDDRELKPRERLTFSIRTDELDFDLSRGFVGTARLASGKEVASAVEHLDQTLLDEIAAHNRGAR